MLVCLHEQKSVVYQMHCADRQNASVVPSCPYSHRPAAALDTVLHGSAVCTQRSLSYTYTALIQAAPEGMKCVHNQGIELTGSFS